LILTWTATPVINWNWTTVSGVLMSGRECIENKYFSSFQRDPD